MTIVEKIGRYFSALEKDFHQHYNDVSHHYSDNTVHDLRVNMKRQTAFFHLLEHLDPSFSVSIALDTYGKLYKRAGKVRDFQVEKVVARKKERQLQLEHDFSNWLAEQETRQSEKLRAYEVRQSLAPVRRLALLVKNRIKYLPDKELPLMLAQYFQRLMAELRPLFSETLEEEALHNLRKLFKVLFYNIKLLNSLKPKKKISKGEISVLDRFQRMLGKWHDLYFVIERSRGDERRPCPPELIERLEKEKKRSVRHIRKRLETIAQALDQLPKRLKEAIDSLPHTRDETVRRSNASRRRESSV
jgi:hypothetical protein